MESIKTKLRVSFGLFLVVSAVILLRQKGGGADPAAAYAQRIETILYIFILTFVCALYIAWESYRIIRLEMIERMEMLEAGRNDLQTIYNSLSMLLIEVENDGKIGGVNGAVCAYLGMGRNHIIGKTLRSALHFDGDTGAAARLEQAVRQTLTDGGSSREEIESGGKVYEIATFPLQASPDTSKKVLLMLDDVTQARAIYRQMFQENKMAAIGQLAAGVAHEIRNPLGLIRNYCYLLQNAAPDDEALKAKALSAMEDAVERSGAIIENLLRFSRISGETRMEINLSQAIHSIIRLEEVALLKKNIRLIVRCDEGICVRVILNSLEMILINLINNAVDAIEDEGTIAIDCEMDADVLVIRVSDTGAGIPAEIQNDVFNPFFTTKEKYNGSGLGLYIVYNEAGKQGGSVSLESHPGAGAAFTIRLPAGI
ncbi:MAG: PAS domain-containing protein [Clostridiales Family XIII bacterium]|jgi:polar amino acid transport system substrate-binding protein|nr:PAS domain-containing protein [Clostridiales Family XIII bacterium]